MGFSRSISTLVGPLRPPLGDAQHAPPKRFRQRLAPFNPTSPVRGGTHPIPISHGVGYLLVVGTHPDGTDLFNSGILYNNVSSINMSDLPAGRTLYAELLTKLDGAWTRYQAITFTAAVGHATFTNPQNGQNNVNNAQPFTWATIPGAQGYILVVGTTRFGTDLVNSGILPATQSTYSVPKLPASKVLYATLLTKVNGTFSRYQAITFEIS